MSYNHEYPYTDPYRSNADWLINKVKEFEAELDSWKSTIEQLVAALSEINAFDERISALEEATSDLDSIRAQLAAIESNLSDAFIEIDKLADKISGITLNYDVVLSELERLASLFPVYLSLGHQYTDAKVYELSVDVNAHFFAIEREIEELKKTHITELLNPVRGSKNDLQTSYNMAYADMRDNAITDAEFFELGLTASQFAALGVRAKEFALNSRKIFKLDYITAPISGLKKKISHAISELLEFIVGALTVNEFAGLDMTCDEFAALDYSCIDFLLGNDSNKGLTASEFSDIIISGGSNILRV